MRQVSANEPETQARGTPNSLLRNAFSKLPESPSSPRPLARSSGNLKSNRNQGQAEYKSTPNTSGSHVQMPVFSWAVRRSSKTWHCRELVLWQPQISGCLAHAATSDSKSGVRMFCSTRRVPCEKSMQYLMPCVSCGTRLVLDSASLSPPTKRTSGRLDRTLGVRQHPAVPHLQQGGKAPKPPAVVRFRPNETPSKGLGP